MKTRLLTLLTPLLLLSLVFIPQTALAKTAAPHIPFDTCQNGVDCEGGFAPPTGYSNCMNSGSSEPLKNIYDHNSVKIGELNFFYSSVSGPNDTCDTNWAGLKNTSGSTFHITSLQIIEAGSDSSVEGEQHGSNNYAIGAGLWDSSLMDEWVNGSGACFHVLSVITDENGFTGITTNSATRCV